VDRVDIRRATAITGVGESPYVDNRGGNPVSWPHSAQGAAIGALEDAGLQPGDIDGVICWGENHWTLGPRRHLDLMELLGVEDAGFASSVATGGVSPVLSLWLARWAIATGRCRHVLLCNGGGFEPEAEMAFDGGRLGAFLAMIPHHSMSYEQPFGPMITTYYAAMTMRHMYEFGTTSEQLAEVAVASRKHAHLNPAAKFRDLITIEDVLDSRMVCDPLHLLDCGGGVRGASGAAIVVSAADRARDLRQPPVSVAGMGLGQSAYFMGALAKGNGRFDLVRTVAGASAEAAFAEAGMVPADVDTVQTHDNFTSSVLIHLEDCGFCPKGEGGSFVEGGRLGPGGALPTNTDGGHMNHPGSLLARQIEAVRQLRGESGPRQVRDAEVAFTIANAGIASTTATAIFVRG
jgi:acetyl-CoA acetyltransferase